MNSGDGGFAVSGSGPEPTNHKGHEGARRNFFLPTSCSFVSFVVHSWRLRSTVEAQDGISLAQFPVTVERSEALTGVKVLVVLGDHQTFRLQQPGTG
jgi:hypothetical protein